MEGEDEPNAEEARLFKRLLELKDLYDTQRKELGVQVVGKEGAKFIPEESDNEDDLLEEDDLGEDEDEDRKLTARPTKKRKGNLVIKDKFESSVPHMQQLQALIRGIIERHGGSSHIDTIIEFVKMRWQKELVLKSDGTAYGHADCKRLIQTNLKNAKFDGRPLFMKDKDNEGCWMVTPAQEERYEIPDSKYKPLSVAIAEAIEESGGMSHLEDIYDWLDNYWGLKPTTDGAEVTKPEIQLHVRVTLTTNPRFVEDSENPDYYILTQKKKTKRLHHNNIRRGTDSDNDRRVATIRAKKSRQDALDMIAKSNKIRKNEEFCKCKGTEPGNGRWRRGDCGDFICTTCWLPWNKEHSCPVCGQAYKKDENDDDENAWIRCDDCHRWVMLKCDTIKDLSIYDDSNPNHLHYSCPVCRSQHIGMFPLPKIPINGKLEILLAEKLGKRKLASGHSPTLPVPNGKKHTSIIIDIENSDSSDDDDTSSTMTSTTTATTTILESESGSIADPNGTTTTTTITTTTTTTHATAKLESTERLLLDKLTEEFKGSKSTLNLIEDEDIKEKILEYESAFADDIMQFCGQLIRKRENERSKLQVEFEDKVRKLKEERNNAEQQYEQKLVQDLRSFFKFHKKEFDRQRAQLLTIYHNKLDSSNF